MQGSKNSFDQFTTIMITPTSRENAEIDFTRQDLVEEMLSKQPFNEDDEHCMRLSDLAALRRVPGNTICVDCGKTDPDWASISLGVFMCLECSGQHRSLGTHVSKVRSVRMDSWSPEQLHIMKVGGNKQCLDFLAQHRSIDDDQGKSTTISERYDCAAAMWYQQILKARRDNLPEPTQMPEYTPSRRTLISRESMGSSSGSHSNHRRSTMESNLILQETSKHVENAIKNSQLVVVTQAKGLFHRLSMHLSPKGDESAIEEAAIDFVGNSDDTSSNGRVGSLFELADESAIYVTQVEQS